MRNEMNESLETREYNINNDNVKIGFEEDAEYLGAVGKIIKKWFAVPKLVSKIQDLEKFQIVTCIFLFSAEIK